MNQVLLALGMFSVLGSYLFLFYRWWFQHLTNLAKLHDVSKRREIATRQYILLIPFIAIPMTGGGVLLSLHLFRLDILILVTLFIASITPACIYWFKRVPVVRGLGYGRPLPSKLDVS